MAQDKSALQNSITEIRRICDRSNSRSQLFLFGGSGYTASITHYYSSSTEIAECAVQPGSVEDLKLILKVIAKARVPFAVKCGGHSTNPRFSSTKGIQIHLSRFNKVTVRREVGLVDIGAGCLFGEVYSALNDTGLGIVGGSGLAAVGVAGWLLGGGYSDKTCRYGLGIDSIQSASILLPDGTFKKVSATENEDLFFAIKGGGNNFGIITEFTLKTHQEEQYQLFRFTYANDLDGLVPKISRFSASSSYNTSCGNIKVSCSVRNTANGPDQELITVLCAHHGHLSYGDPFRELKYHTYESHEIFAQPSVGGNFYVADLLLSSSNETCGLSQLPEIPTSSEQLNHQRTEFPKRSQEGSSQFLRGRWGSVMVDKITTDIINEIREQTKEVSQKIKADSGSRVEITIWPFPKSMFDLATPSAWPHEKGKPNFPIIVSLGWVDEARDGFFVDLLKSTLENLRQSIHGSDGALKDLPVYPNTALPEVTTVEDIYRDNLERLRVLKWVYDPKGVMCLAGGFKIHHTYGVSGRCGCGHKADQA